MNNRISKLITILIVLPAIALLLLWFVILKPSAEKKINSIIQQSNIPLSGDPFKVFFLGLRSQSALNLNIRPLPLSLQAPVISISTLSLLRLAPKIRLNANLYGGELNCSMTYGIADQSISMDLKADNVLISKYQLASMLGFTDGIITASVEGRSSGHKELLPKEIFLMIKNLQKPRAGKLPSIISPIPVNLPALENGELIAAANCDDKECRSTRLSLKSSLGELAGNFLFPAERPDLLQLTATVSLTQSGRKELLPYFALVNQELLNSPDRPFMIKLANAAGKIKLSVVPLQDSM